MPGLNQESYVKIDEGDMGAWLFLKPPEEGSPKYTKEDIMTYLHEHGVVRGYHTSNIAAVVKKEVYEREIKIAQGKQPIAGKDGYYEYKFSPVVQKGPKILEDGTVDYSSMSELQNVSKGDVIAVYHRAVQGEVGYSVKGAELKSKPAKELPPLRGKGIAQGQDADTYVADMDGKIEIRDGKVDIKAVHEVQGDVDLITPKIEFFGDIIINGNVSAGVMIRAGRNITVKGTAEAVTMFAGGDIVLERGIQGGQKAQISAKGNIFADFIEHTAAQAGENIQANIILNSQVRSEQRVIAAGKKGFIIGGYVHGLLGIEATEIGNYMEVKTSVHAGFEPEVYNQFLAANAKEQRLEEALSETVKEMSDILKLRKNTKSVVNKMNETKLIELNAKKDECFAQLDSVKQEKQALSDVIAKGRGAKILLSGKIYRGVTVGVENAVLHIEKGNSFTKYECIGGVVDESVRAI